MQRVVVDSESIGQLWEGDIDLVLVMDALAGGPITAELYARVGSAASDLQVTRSAWRTGGRETDVLVSGEGGTLLIEDKLHAIFQPDQPDSYRQEADRLRAAGQPAWAVLVCPAHSRAAYESEAGDSFDLIVTLEELADVAERHAHAVGDSLASVSATVLRSAAAIPRSSGVTNNERMAWGQEYRRLLASLVPSGHLVVGPGCFRTINSINAWFADVQLPGLYGFGHFPMDGYVEAEFHKDTHRELPAAPPADAEIGSTKRLLFVRYRVEPMEFMRSPTEQGSALRDAALAALKLRDWLMEVAAERSN